MVEDNYDRERLISDLREMIKLESIGNFEDSQTISNAAWTGLNDGGEWVDSVPHEVWHFLTDADIRKKDADYLIKQTSKILIFLEQC